MLREHVEIGALTIDVAARAARIDGELVQLTVREFDLLVALAKDPTRVFTKAELLSDLWNHPDPRSTRTLDSHACRLRRRLAEHGQNMVCNEWGVGYRLVP
jgi:DNA-binding response OmpR family regulator